MKSLKNGIVLNVLGMGAAILGMQATVGLLVAKALTTSANPYYQGIPPGSSPVLALDVFLVQVLFLSILFMLLLLYIMGFDIELDQNSRYAYKISANYRFYYIYEFLSCRHQQIQSSLIFSALFSHWSCYDQ